MNYLAKARKEKAERAALCIIESPKEDNIVRSEYAKEADINTIVARVLAGQPVAMKQGTFGTRDDSYDLTAQISAADALAREYDALPEETRKRLSPEQFLAAVQKRDKDTLFPPPEPPETDEQKQKRAEAYIQEHFPFYKPNTAKTE